MTLLPKSKLLRAVIPLAGLALVVALFYAEEDWRGVRAWENCKRDMEAKGEVLDWTNFIPAPVPDGQNFFKAPKMAEWFVKNRSPDFTNELVKRLSFANTNSVVMAEVTVAPASSNVSPPLKNADLVLRYSSFGTSIFLEANSSGENESSNSTNDAIVPIQLTDCPITAAIESLARNAGINYLLDPKIDYGQPDQNGQIKPEPELSIRWENIMRLTKKAEPPPTRGVNRDSRTDSANGGWLRRMVRRHG